MPRIPHRRWTDAARVLVTAVETLLPERQVRDQGAISFRNRSWFVSRGLVGLPVAVRPTTTDGIFRVVYCHREVAIIDLTDRSGA